MTEFDTSKYGFRTVFPNRFMTGETEYETYDYYCNSFNDLMYQVSKFYAFGDCTDEEIIAIFAKETPIFYCGWMPNMEFKFVDDCGVVVWDEFYPEWDH